MGSWHQKSAIIECINDELKNLQAAKYQIWLHRKLFEQYAESITHIFVLKEKSIIQYPI